MGRHHHTGRVLAVMVTVTVALTSGCGTHRVDPQAANPTGDPSISIPLLPSANDFITAVVNTGDRGAARLTIDVSTTIDNVTETSKAVGKGFTRLGFADLTWTSAGIRTREVVNDQGIFVQTDLPNGRWLHHPVGSSTPTSAAADPLRDLGMMRTIVNEGGESLDGIHATRYTGSLPSDQGEVAVTAWVDDAGLIIRVDRQQDSVAPDGRRKLTTSSTTLGDFGTLLLVTSPPSGQVDQASGNS